jgi:hypothetical protein
MVSRMASGSDLDVSPARPPARAAGRFVGVGLGGGKRQSHSPGVDHRVRVLSIHPGPSYDHPVPAPMSTTSHPLTSVRSVGDLSRRHRRCPRPPDRTAGRKPAMLGHPPETSSRIRPDVPGRIAQRVEPPGRLTPSDHTPGVSCRHLNAAGLDRDVAATLYLDVQLLMTHVDSPDRLARSSRDSPYD